jgi:hypothetical protein
MDIDVGKVRRETNCGREAGGQRFTIGSRIGLAPEISEIKRRWRCQKLCFLVWYVYILVTYKN